MEVNKQYIKSNTVKGGIYSIMSTNLSVENSIFEDVIAYSSAIMFYESIDSQKNNVTINNCSFNRISAYINAGISLQFKNFNFYSNPYISLNNSTFQDIVSIGDGAIFNIMGGGALQVNIQNVVYQNIYSSSKALIVNVVSQKQKTSQI